MPYFGKIQVDYGKMPMIRLFALQKLFYIMDGKARKIYREKEGDMAGALNVRHGSKMRLAFDAPLGQEPKFNMICTFNKALDESAFLVSIPMVGGKALPLDEKRRICGRRDQRGHPPLLEGSPRQ